MGGSNEPENLIELSVEEHAEAHRQLYEKYGRWQDKLAWDCLRGHIVGAAAIKAAQRNFHTPEKKREWSERMSRNRRAGICVNKPDINAKQYVVTKPDGTEEIITNLRQWTRANGLNEDSVRNVVAGKRNSIYGYKVRLNGTEN